MSGSLPHQITAGFIPLLDSALLVAAKEKGFAAAAGVDLLLVRETSWANIRDRLAVGHFNVAHMLAPMPIACNLGLTPLASRTIAPMALGLGGNAITVSSAVWAAMQAHGAGDDLDPKSAGSALKAVVDERARAGRDPLRLAVVHPHSGHNYEMRYWLAACGIDPEREIEIVIVPPSLMADALGTGSIDGYCVGEPWNTAAVLAGSGHIATVKAAIWRSSPEKVLGVQAAWAETHPEALAALLRALYARRRLVRRCRQSRRAGVHAVAAGLSRHGRESGCCRRFQAASGPAAKSGRLRISSSRFARAATFPWKSHALWFYSQMVRWRQIGHNSQNAELARDTYRPDLYRAALKPLGVALPGANAKVEGALTAATPVGSAGASLVLGPDGFFDGAIFDPDEIDRYIAAQARPADQG